MPAKGREHLLAEVILNPAREPPRALLRRLRSGEVVVWWSRGRGLLLDLDGAVLILCTLTFLGVIGALMFVLSAPLGPVEILDPKTAFNLLAIAAPAAFGMFRMFKGPALELYAVTSHRVVVIPFGVSLFARSVVVPLSPGDVPTADYESAVLRIRHPPIKRLLATGRKDVGNLRLRGLEGNDHPGAAPFVMVGIKHPLEVAQLIKSTLKLDLPIEDLTR